MAKDSKKVKVWDPVVRIGHWLLIPAVFTAYFSEDDLMPLHIVAGYVVSTIVLIRLIWGFCGSRYARFADFVYSPAAILAYLQQMLSGKSQHYIGHNPAGGAMVVALLLSLAATSLSGLKLYALEENDGPWAWAAEIATSNGSPQHQIKSGLASPSANTVLPATDKKSEEFWEELHELFANLTLALATLHITAVLYSSRREKQQLITAMLSGVKEIDDSYK